MNKTKADPRTITKELIMYTQALYQNKAITNEEKNTLTKLILSGITNPNGYNDGKLEDYLKRLISIMAFMNEVPQKMITIIKNNPTQRKENEYDKRRLSAG